MNNTIEFLKGKKTYFTVAIAALYLTGVYLGFWPWDERVIAVLGLSSVAFLRAAINKGPTLLLCFLLSALCFSGIGCGTPGKYGQIMSVSTWFVGARVMTTSASTQTPEVWLGVGRQTVTYIPTSTNGTIAAPRFGSGFTSDQTAWNPLSANAAETVFSGDVMVGTNATGGAIVPKLRPLAQ